MRGWRARARPHGNSAVRPCGKTLSVLYTHGNSAVLDGSPLHSGHALLSTLFSLFSFFTKKAPSRIVVRNGAFGEKRFAPRCFHALLNALSSPRGALTAVFGMGTGVSPPPVARTKGIGSGRLDPGNGALLAPATFNRPRTGPSGAAFRRPPCCPPAPSPPGGVAGGRRPDLTAYQKRYGERLAALAHPPCQAGVLPAAFRDLRPGRLISGGAWRLDAFSAYPFATWLPGGADGSTTGTPEVARPRSSRTRGRSRQPSCACGG